MLGTLSRVLDGPFVGVSTGGSITVVQVDASTIELAGEYTGGPPKGASAEVVASTSCGFWWPLFSSKKNSIKQGCLPLVESQCLHLQLLL